MPKPTLDVALALVQRGEQWLVAKRKRAAHLGGLWEFPGGKQQRDETATAAALRELSEECGVDATPLRVLNVVRYEYEDRIVRITPVVCAWIAGEAQPLAADECRWVTVDELRRLAMPEVNAGIIRAALETPK